MSTINTCIGRYCLKARVSNGVIEGSIAINGESGTAISVQRFREHHLNDVLNKVIYPVTGGNHHLTDDFRRVLHKAGFTQSH
ncbi:hypothetical protein [Pantoea sp. 1.19]|uniref:hypothetical protein n=1 Tax=Pantoea sp. 1.19 TaxID=1925589 RepID=UPI000948C10E|nr:hypothetical protein [Pantoea sp. 1.19]